MTAELPPGIDPQLAIDALTISVTGPDGQGEPLVYVLSEDADVTSLGVEATMTVSLDPLAMDPFVRAIVENEMRTQDMELTEENVQAFMALVSAQLGDSLTFSEYIGEVAEVRPTDEGIWLICGGSIVESDPASGTQSTATPGPSAVASESTLVPSVDPLPYAEYVAALEAFTQDDPFAGLSDPPTKKEVLVGLRKLRASSMTEQERLLALVPEGCYADAHAELLGYWQSSIEGVTEAAVQLKSSSLAELISITDAMDDDAPAAPPQRVRGGE